MATEVVMPRMGETVDEGTVNAWHKAVGDQVTEGEPLLEIGTDKVDTDIPAPASGTLAACTKTRHARPGSPSLHTRCRMEFAPNQCHNEPLRTIVVHSDSLCAAKSLIGLAAEAGTAPALPQRSASRPG